MEERITEMLYLMDQTKKTKPLVHCLTNPLTANDCANILLAVGARPIMAYHLDEVEEITSHSKALLINIGGITDYRIESIFHAGKVARHNHIPIIFDPVGAAGSGFRKALSKKILAELKPHIIKGNMSEIKALCDLDTDARGVDVSPSDVITSQNTSQLTQVVKTLAARQNAVVVATGKTDIIADPSGTYLIENGVSLLPQVTGTGCMCTSLISAYTHSHNYLEAALLGVTAMGIAGELAQETSRGIGSFKVALFDHLYTISPKLIKERSKIIAYS